MALYKTMVNYEKTTSMYIYGHLFTELKENSEEGSAIWRMTAHKNLEKSMKGIIEKYRKKQFTYKTVQHHACVNEMLTGFQFPTMNKSLHVQQSLHKDVSEIFYNDILSAMFMPHHAALY